MLPDQHLALAKERHLAGDLAGARSLYETVLAVYPAEADVMFRLGVLTLQCGACDDALAWLDRALSHAPQEARYHFARAQVLATSQRFDEAVALLNKAVQLMPNSPASLLNLGVALLEQRRFDEAATLLEHTLALDPQFPEAAYNLGNALHALGKRHEAQAQYRLAIALDPHHADAYNNLGNVCRDLGEFDSALDAFDAALRARPAFVAACNNAGNLMRTLHRTAEAETLFGAALSIDPDHSASHNNLGNVLKDTGALDEGTVHYRRAVQSDPGNVVAHSNLAYALTFQSEDGEAAFDECRRWSALHETPLRATREPHANDRNAHRRLRIGYVSPDFRDHCQSLFTVPLLSHHNHDQFEIYCYASVERPDALTQRIAAYADVWRDVHGFDDGRLAQQIRADGIDILVDLAMHMADGRPLLFARKPAPVQVAWLAYPGTTGLDAIDYRLTDPRLDPPSNDTLYSERSLRLPDSFWCYDPLTDQPAVNALPALTAGHLTFGCLNNPCKLTDRTLGMWAAVLREVPHTRNCCSWRPLATHAKALLHACNDRASTFSASVSSRSARALNTCARITRSTSGSTRFRTTATRQASTRCGWTCR